MTAILGHLTIVGRTHLLLGEGCSSREVSDKDDSHASADDDIPLKALGGSSRHAPRASNGEHVVQVQYDDGNVDLLDLIENFSI